MNEKPTLAEIEQASANAPTAAALHQENQKRAEDAQQRMIDLQNRQFCIEQTTKACSAGGYDPADIMKVAQGFYGFLIGQTTQDAAMRENAPPKVPLRKS